MTLVTSVSILSLISFVVAVTSLTYVLWVGHESKRILSELKGARVRHRRELDNAYDEIEQLKKELKNATHSNVS